MPQTFNPDTAFSYQQQLQSYQDKIDSGTITSQEIQEARALSAQYYQYLADSGIEYGIRATQVVENSIIFGAAANGILSDAILDRDPSISSQRLDMETGEVSISLALRDSVLRSQTQDGAISSRQIANYHYDVFESHQLPRDAWGGSFFEEFVGSGSWMGLDNLTIQDYSSGLMSIVSCNSFNGVNSCYAFSRIARSSDDVFERIKEVATSIRISIPEITPNPQLENSDLIIAQDGDNILIGNRGQANTFYIPTLNGNNVISDFDRQGRIVIGDGVRSHVFEGNAIPKRNAAGEIIANQWSLNDYDLIRSGDNLVIIPAGSDISSPDTPRITIANFPFDLQQGNAFGLTLGKRQTNTMLPRRVASDSRSVRLMDSVDDRVRFITVASDVEANLSIRIHDVAGNIIRQTKFTESFNNLNENGSEGESKFSQVSGHTRLPNGNWAIGYYSLQREVSASRYLDATLQGHLLIIDAYGNIISNSEIAEINDVRLAQGYGFSVGININNLGNLNYFLSFTFSSSERQVFHGILAPSGGVINEVVRIDLDNTQYSGRTETAVRPLANGVIVTPIFQGGGIAAFDISAPALENMPASEIPVQEEIAAGGQELETTDLDRAIITFQNRAFGELASSLKITPHPNARILIRNVVDGAIDLEDFGLSQAEIAQRTSQVSSRDFSAQDLLSQDFRPRREVNLQQLMPNASADLEIDEEDLEERARRDEESEELIAQALADNSENFVILQLPVIADGQNSSMFLIFLAQDREEFLNQTLPFNFVGYQRDDIDFTTPRPTFWQNSTPNFFPTSPAINGTQNPQITGPTPSLSPAAISAIVVGAVVLVAGVGVAGYKLITDEDFRHAAQERVGRVLSALNPQNWFRQRQAQVLPAAEGGDELQAITRRNLWVEGLQNETDVDAENREVNEDELADLEERIFEREEPANSRPVTPFNFKRLQGERVNQVE